MSGQDRMKNIHLKPEQVCIALPDDSPIESEREEMGIGGGNIASQPRRDDLI